MPPLLPQLGERERDIVGRVVAVAEADPRFAAVAVVGSRAVGTADHFSDLDFVFVVEDDAFDELVLARHEVLSSVGRLLWCESWALPERWFFIFANGVEGDLSVIRASNAASGITGPFVVVWDRAGLLRNVRVSPSPPPTSSGESVLGGLLRNFWHEFGHLTKGLGRDQLWWASGQLEAVRGMCVNLMRLTANFDDPEIGDEPYWKVELSLPHEALEQLRPTLSGPDRAGLVKAAVACLDLFCELAEPLASARSIPFPDELAALARTQVSQLQR